MARLDPEHYDIETHWIETGSAFDDNGGLPVLVYRKVLDDPTAEAFEDLYSANGWAGSWRDGIYDYHHFHSNAHEVLAIARGKVRVQLGGPDGPQVDAAAGDVIIIPAGTGHKNVESDADLLVVGAYPQGQTDYDMRRGDESERQQVARNVHATPRPRMDPIFSGDGPLLEHWSN